MQKDPSGKPAPAGGFQNLGWYSGYQYYNGSFAPQAGMIHPQSPQQGAGQFVSPEVNAQSAALQGVSPQQFQSYINTQNQTYTPTPTSSPFSQARSAGTSGAGAGVGFTAPQVPNFPDIYKGLYESSGISQSEAQYSEMEKQFINAKSKINDNPFLSEATRVGRVAKLEQLFNERTANIKNEIATKKADVETQLNLQLKQFDITSQAARDALSQFNTLLGLGALDGASGEDIANITRSTGLSSSMIYSAIDANRKKNVSTSTISFDDGTNQGFAIINDKTGEIISKQTIAASKPTKSSSSGSTSYKTSFVEDANAAYGESDIFPRLVQAYAPLMSLQDIYRLYASSDPGKYYGSPVEDATQIKQIYNAARGG